MAVSALIFSNLAATSRVVWALSKLLLPWSIEEDKNYKEDCGKDKKIYLYI